MRLAIATIALLATLASHQAQAVRFIGAGIMPCSAWTADHKRPTSPNAIMQDQWVLGFISGGAARDPDENFDPLHGLEAFDVLFWVANWCQANPQVPVANAAGAFMLAHP